MDRADEVARKLGSVRDQLDRLGLDAVAFRTVANVAWLTAGARAYVSAEGTEGVVAAFVTPGAAYLATSNIERQRLLDEEVTGLPFELLDTPWHEGPAHQALAGLSDPARTACDVAWDGYAPLPAELLELRRSLCPEEVERYRELGRDAAACVEEACRHARPGDSELDVAAHLADRATAAGILPLVDLVAADERIASYRHPLPTGNRLRATLMVVLSGRRQGLYASCTRMVHFGEPDPDLAARHLAVSRVDACMLLASRPGRSLGSVVTTAIEAYAAQGFAGQWRLHHQGGLTGYAGREIFATPQTPYALRAGQALAWNPSLTGAKSEDTIHIDASGYEVLTRTGSWPQQEIELPTGTALRPALLQAD
jgi:antitoxin VapB